MLALLMLRPLLHLYRDAYAGLPRAVWVLAGAVLVNRMGSMVIPFLTLYLTKDLGLSAAEVGWLLSAWGFSGLVGTYLGGRLCEHFDPVVLQTWILIATGLLLPCVGLARTKPTLYLGFVLFGLVGESFRPANAVAIANACPPGRRRRASALRRLAINFGMAIGPTVGGLMAVHSYLWLFVVDGATTFAAGLVLAFFLRRSPPPPRRIVANAAEAEAATDDAVTDDHPRFDSPWRDPLYLAFAALLTLASILFFQILTVYLLTLREVFGLGEDRIGLTLAINPLLIVVFEMLLTHRTRRLPALPLIAVGTLALGAGLGLLPLGSSWGWALLLVPLWTLGEMLIYPLSESVASNRATDVGRGAYLAVHAMTFSLSALIAPPLGTAVWERFGADALWHGVGAVAMLCAVGFVLLHVAGLRDVPETS